MGVVTLAFHVTDRCQLDCKHCLRDPAQKPLDLPRDVLERVLDQVTRLHGTAHVSLTGGEPTLHPEFVEIIDAIGARGLTWHMVSNGRNFGWLMERFAERPARRGAMSQVYFSLDGADEATHDAIRGEGSFRQVMAACALATAHQIPFTLQLVVNAHNQHQLEALGLMASQLGAIRVSFCVLQPTGTPHDRALYLSAAEWRAVSDRVDRLAHTLRLEVRTPEGWPQRQPFHVCEPFRSEQLHVDVEGRLNLCCQHAGIPQAPSPPSGESDIVADLRTTPFVEAHARLLGVIHRAQAAKLQQIAEGRFGEWDHFPCNWCLAHFGKPHWSDAGAAGPEAARERWIGAWGEPKDQAPARARLRVLP
jgi:MoaA/NifB/PqqE/SkfB family radical SAM enzyme